MSRNDGWAEIATGPREEVRKEARRELTRLMRETAGEGALRTTMCAQSFECAARRQGSVGGNDPADCDWPVCGCDPYADKVIATLDEMGALAQGIAAAKPSEPKVQTEGKSPTPQSGDAP